MERKKENGRKKILQLLISICRQKRTRASRSTYENWQDLALKRGGGGGRVASLEKSSRRDAQKNEGGYKINSDLDF